MSKTDKSPSLLARPTLWLVLSVIAGGMVSTVQWQHPQAFMIAAGLASVAAVFLVLAAFLAGRRTNAGPDVSVLAEALDNSTDGYLVTDIDGAFIYSNASLHRLLAFAGANDAGRRVLSIEAIVKALDDGDGEQVARLQSSLRDAGTGHVEFAVRRREVNSEWRRLTVSPIKNKAGSVTGALWRVEDITSSTEVEAIRRAEEDRISDMLDLLPVGFFSADKDGILLYVNQTFARWIGLPPERMRGMAFADLIAEVDGEEEIILKDTEGRTFAIALEQSQKDDPLGDVAYTRSIVLRDLVWLDPARDARDEAAAVDAAGDPGALGTADGGQVMWLYDEAPVAIIKLDLNGVINDCNRAFTKLIGIHRDNCVGKPFADWMAKEDRGDLTACMSKIVMGISRGAQLEIRLPASGDRELVTDAYVRPIVDRDNDVIGLALHLINMTEQKNLEVQFTQSQKMQAVGQLAGGVAHDFNNLLTAMIGFCDLLLQRHGPDDPSFEDIQHIRQNANRATNLVRQLLAFSRKQTLQPVRLEVPDLLSELSNLLRRLIGETVELVIEHGKSLPAIKADRGQFDQVIINLAVNARDAMPGGGTLTIRSSDTRLDASVQRGHDLMPAGRYTLIEVSDTGEGISRENLDRIFEPFFTTKDVGSGTGLGLSTVYGIIHQTGGYIFVDSAPGEGTSFSIYLPAFEDEALLSAPEGLATGPAAAPVPADLTGQGTILLVEDEGAVRMFAARALRNKGYLVLEAENGEAALDTINGQDQKIDLIVSDVIMPGMDGHTFVNLVRQELKDVKVILMSGYAEETFRDEIGRDSSIHFLGKPFTLKDLATKVKTVLDGR
ncbi:MAG: PAS domain-containing protein [Rhodospirillales bacterium]|nr:PAS domain-containing protein [Rhodospirillales bacterium]